LGNCGTVGMAGLTLGGGYGPLCGTCGLAADNLLGAEMVLADGRRVTTGPDAEPDLFWALRGGGGNFGVATSLRIRLHPARDLLAGSIIYNWNEAGAVLRRYAAFAATAPDELGVAVGVMSGPDGEPVIMAVPLWNGERFPGERAMEEVRAFGTPQSAQVGPATYADLLAQFDAWLEAAGRVPLGDPDALVARAYRGRRRCDHRGEGPRGVATLLGVLAPLPRRRDADGARWRRVRPPPRALHGGDRRGLEARWG
jgi:FAD/FMN-containing dehydrogenase